MAQLHKTKLWNFRKQIWQLSYVKWLFSQTRLLILSTNLSVRTFTITPLICALIPSFLYIRHNCLSSPLSLITMFPYIAQSFWLISTGLSLCLQKSNYWAHFIGCEISKNNTHFKNYQWHTEMQHSPLLAIVGCVPSYSQPGPPRWYC